MKAPKKSFTFRISQRQKEFVEERAYETDLSASAWVGRLIEREMAAHAARDAAAAAPPARKKPAR